jgi:hypothetical protein
MARTTWIDRIYAALTGASDSAVYYNLIDKSGNIFPSGSPPYKLVAANTLTQAGTPHSAANDNNLVQFADANNIVWYAIDSGTVNAITITTSDTATAWYDGWRCLVKMKYANTSTTVTINANGWGAKTVVIAKSVAPYIADLNSDTLYEFAYDSTIDKVRILAGAFDAYKLNGALSSASATANTIMLRDSAGQAKVTAPSVGTDLTRLIDARWTLLQTYATAGTFTWTAPDFIGDGSTYTVIAIIDGGGGAGGLSMTKYSSGSFYCIASGGSSGYRKFVKLTVTPGNMYAVVVGAGGAAAALSITQTTGATPFGNFVTGGTGGSSAFNGVTASGGNGGTGSNHNVSVGTDSLLATGGQSATSLNFIYEHTNTLSGLYVPAYGQAARAYAGSDYYRMDNGITAAEFINPFDPSERLLSAGAGASVGYNAASVYAEIVLTLSDGYAGGTGYGKYSETALTVATSFSAGSATSPGSGGGACVLHYVTSDTYTLTGSSGAGAHGQVRIYAGRIS